MHTDMHIEIKTQKYTYVYTLSHTQMLTCLVPLGIPPLFDRHPISLSASPILQPQQPPHKETQDVFLLIWDFSHFFSHLASDQTDDCKVCDL